MHVFGKWPLLLYSMASENELQLTAFLHKVSRQQK